MNSEGLAFQIISIAGDGMGLYFKALEEAKKGNFEQSDILYNEASENIKKAHKIQSEALFNEAKGEKIEINILLVHAQDHLMNCILAKEFIKEFIELYKKDRREE
jgi:PTS system cellobiose-specific IIA component